MDTVRRFVFEQRRLLAALCAGVAVLLALGSLEQDADGTTVLVAARDLPSGHRLGVDDLSPTTVPVHLVPEGTVVAAEEVLGRRVAAPLRRGEVLTDVRVVSPGALAGRPAGTVLAPVRVTDAEDVAAVRVGDRIDVVAVAPEGDEGRIQARVVARGVEVVNLPVAGEGGEPASLGVATDEETALRLAAVSLESRLSVLTAGGDG